MTYEAREERKATRKQSVKRFMETRASPRQRMKNCFHEKRGSEVDCIVYRHRAALAIAQGLERDTELDWLYISSHRTYLATAWVDTGLCWLGPGYDILPRAVASD